MTGARTASRNAAAVTLMLLGGCAAIALGWLSIGANLTQSCATRDTPYLELCPPLKTGSPEHIDALRSRIAANPGDTNAYLQLSMADRSPQRPKLIEAARALAPNQPNMLRMQAIESVEKQEWATAIVPMIQLTEHHDNPHVAMALARLIGEGRGQLLMPYLKPGTQWFARVLAQMRQAKVPLSAALPLVVEAMKAGLLDTGTIRNYIRDLKAGGAWADAFSLWVSLHGKPLPTLYNGKFDEVFQVDGFDWEITATGPANKIGAVVERRAAEQRGGVLDINFTGRAMQVPLVRQLLFLGEGSYRLRGEYMARQFRMEEGLAWSVRCVSKDAPQAGRSAALSDTAGGWKPFEFEFKVPKGCGLIAILQLETFAPFEAATGARGRVAFDAFSLEKLPSKGRS